MKLFLFQLPQEANLSTYRKAYDLITITCKKAISCFNEITSCNSLLSQI